MPIPIPNYDGLQRSINEILRVDKIGYLEGQVDYEPKSRTTVRRIGRLVGSVPFPGVGLRLTASCSGMVGKWDTSAKVMELTEMRVNMLRWSLREEGARRRGPDGYWGGTPIAIEGQGICGRDGFAITVLEPDSVRQQEEGELEDEDDYLEEEFADIAFAPSSRFTSKCPKLLGWETLV